jgi:F-type H+-transporting ATPase subunit b
MMVRLIDYLRGSLVVALLTLTLVLGLPPASAQDHSATEPATTEPMIEHDVGEAEHGAGMPQLDAKTYASQIFWLIVTFGGLYWLLSRKALPRVAEVLEARQDRIAADLDRAAALRAEAEAAEQQHEQVVAEAHARAQDQIKALTERLAADAASRKAALDADLGRTLRDAETRVHAAREAALAEIRSVAVESSQAAVQRLAGLSLPRETVEAALDRVQREAA